MPPLEGMMLTSRERAVARYLLGGWKQESISYQLEISEQTVHSHLYSILGKYGYHSVFDFVIAAIKNEEMLHHIFEHPRSGRREGSI